MKTIVRQVASADDPAVKHGADIIRGGGLVAFPTETVYGLGADGLSAAACARVYAAKGRPRDNPLILHICDISRLDSIAANIPPAAEELMAHFWPGPVTMIFSSPGHRGTTAVRMPNNPIALELIRLSDVPIAAPSANVSGRPSPTTAAHVLADLDGKIDMILDGGPCEVGLESTVIDFSRERPAILRPGAITREMIEARIGPVCHMPQVAENEAPRAPGMKYKHYAPEAKLTLVTGEAAKVRAAIKNLVCGVPGAGIMAHGDSVPGYGERTTLNMGNNPADVAANLFALLRKCDEMGLKEVFVEGMSEEGLGTAIMNRLEKAASYNIMKV